MKALVPAALALALAAPAAVAAESPQTARIDQARHVLASSVTAPDKGIPKELLERAECVGVFPGLTKGAFVVGGEFGKGVFTCRQANGRMGPPAFFTIAGGSIGWQFGGEEADLVLLVMNPDGLQHLLADRFKLGGEASAVAGPVGRTAEAATDAQLHAEILSWSRSRGAFLGASVEGDVLKPDRDANARFYGKPVDARDVLEGKGVRVPERAQAFVDVASRYTRREGKS